MKFSILLLVFVFFLFVDESFGLFGSKKKDPTEAETPEKTPETGGSKWNPLNWGGKKKDPEETPEDKPNKKPDGTANKPDGTAGKPKPKCSELRKQRAAEKARRKRSVA